VELKPGAAVRLSLPPDRCIAVMPAAGPAAAYAGEDAVVARPANA
jgi:hypothetical protein